MGKTFGNLFYIRNIIYYRVSSYEQKAFGANFIKDSFRNLYSEVRFNAPYILPPFTLGYLFLKWGEAEREKMVRKDPSLHEDEEVE